MNGKTYISSIIDSGRSAIQDALRDYRQSGRFIPFHYGVSVSPITTGEVRIEPFGILQGDPPSHVHRGSEEETDDQTCIPRRPIMFFSEEDGSRHIIVELPGISRDEIRLEVTNNRLIIDATNEHTPDYCYYASVPLPEAIDASDVRAYYQDALLDISLPGADIEIGTRVEITRGIDDETEQRLDQLAGELETAKASAEDYRKQLEKLQIECQTIRNRAQQEKYTFGDQRAAQTILGFLEVVDNFERALDACKTAKNVAALSQGIRMIYEQFMATMRQYGVRPIVTENATFDPHLHEALERVPRSDIEPGKIVNEIVKGYMMNNKVLRPSRVAIAYDPTEKERNPDTDDNNEDEPT